MKMLSNAQLEILKLLANDLSEAELADLKKILMAFKLQRVVQLADKTWDEKGWSQETMDQFLQMHLRTGYQCKGICGRVPNIAHR